MLCCCCGSKQRVLYLEQLNLVYSKVAEFKVDKTGNLDLGSLHEDELSNLEEFVNSNCKPIIDYLENNQRRLKDIGKYINKKVKGSSNPVTHLISLHVFNNVLLACRTLHYDESYLTKLMKRKNKQEPFIKYLLNTFLKRNFSEFERKFLQVINHLLSLYTKKRKNNETREISQKNYDILFPEIVNTIIVYGKHLPKDSKMNPSKNHHIDLVKKILNGRNILDGEKHSKDDWKKQLNILQSLEGLTSKRESIFFLPSLRKTLIDIVFDVLLILEDDVEIRSTNLAESIRASSEQIFKDIVSTDFALFEYDFTFMLIIYKLNSKNWKLEEFRKRFLRIFSFQKNIDKNKSKIEGTILDCLIKLAKEKKIEVILGEEKESQKSQLLLEDSNLKIILNIIAFIFEDGSEFMFSFYYLEMMVQIIVKLYFSPSINEEVTREIHRIMSIVSKKVAEYNISNRYIEYLFRELSIYIGEQGTKLTSLLTFLEQNATIISKQGTMKRGHIISAGLQHSFSLCINNAVLKTEKMNLINQLLQNFALVYSQQYEETETGVFLVYPETEAVQRLLVDLFSINKKTFEGFFELTASKKEDISEVQLIYLIKATFCVFTQLISRGNAEHIPIIISFLKDYKASIIDKFRNWKLNVLIDIYWIYSLYLFSYKWEISQLESLIHERFENLLVQDQTSKSLLLMLKSCLYDITEIDIAAEMLRDERIKIRSDIGWDQPIKLIQEHFYQYDINQAKLGVSLARMEADSTKPDYSLVSNLVDDSIDEGSRRIDSIISYELPQLSEISEDLGFDNFDDMIDKLKKSVFIMSNQPENKRRRIFSEAP